MGPNHVSLYQGQLNFINHGASELRFVDPGRTAEPYPVDPEWRPIEPSVDSFDPDRRHVKETGSYYWRLDYFLAATARH